MVRLNFCQSISTTYRAIMETLLRCIGARACVPSLSPPHCALYANMRGTFPKDLNSPEYAHD